jgi:hypothetical protein
MSVDPVLTDNNTGASFNRYVYANNNPYKYIDPDGRQVIIVLGQRPKKGDTDPFYSPIQASRGDPLSKAIAKALSSNSNTSPNPPPEDEDKEDDKAKKKRPNDKLAKDDEVDLAQFIDRKKVEGEVQFKDPKSGYAISADKSGNRGHGGSAWKLLDSAGNRVGTLTADGKFLRK